MGIFSRPFFGMVNDGLLHGNGVKTLFLVAVTSTASLIAVSGLNTGTPFWLLLVVMSALGFGALGWNAVFLSYVGEISPRGFEATTTSTAFAIAMMGQVIGAPLFGVLVDSNLGYVGAYQVYSIGVFASSVICLRLFNKWMKQTRANNHTTSLVSTKNSIRIFVQQVLG